MIRSLLFISLALFSYAHADLDQDRVGVNACSQVDLLACVNDKEYSSVSCGPKCLTFTKRNANVNAGCPAVCKCTDCKKMQNRDGQISEVAVDDRSGCNTCSYCHAAACDMSQLVAIRRMVLQYKHHLHMAISGRRHWRSRYQKSARSFRSWGSQARQWHSRLVSKTRSNQHISRKYHALQNHVTVMNSRMGECQKSCAKITKLHTQIEQFKEQSTAVKNSVNYFQHSCKTTRQEITVLRRQLGVVRRRVNVLRSQTQQYQLVVTRYSALIKSMHSRFVKWRSSVIYRAQCMLRKAHLMMRTVTDMSYQSGKACSRCTRSMRTFHTRVVKFKTCVRRRRG